MNWFYWVGVWVLVMLCVVLVGRVRKLQKDVDWWKNEALLLRSKRKEE